MSPGQRSKSGCWTCRLRRKKCHEGGPPCANCESRGIFCHGYGPKPAWKDRGDREREEANRLHLQSRRRRESTAARSHVSQPSISSSVSSTTTTSANSIEVITPADIGSPLQSPMQSDFSFSLSPTSQERSAAAATAAEFDFLGALGLGPESSAPATVFGEDLWPSSSAAEALVELTHFQQQHPIPDPPKSAASQEQALCFPFPGVNGCSSGAQTGSQTPEKEIELVMHFIGDTYALQHNSYRTSSTMQKSWLLYLLTRSSTFYYASLSMSAYHYSLSLSGDSETRAVAFQDYQTYRTNALSGFRDLTDANRLATSSASVFGETLICGVQIALLEALGRNMQSCHSYLSSAAQSLLDHEDLLSTSQLSSNTMRQSSISMQLIQTSALSAPTLTRPSPMEFKALSFFRALLIWNDVLSSSARKKVPSAADAYRKLLADGEFAVAFQETTGCESWVLLAIMDAAILESWKRDQEAQGNLSIRELVNRAARLESTVEEGIKRLSSILQRNTTPLGDNTCWSQIAAESTGHGAHHIQTYIFAHAILTHLHTIVSGSLAGVPEIHQSIDRALHAWKLRPSSMNPKSLAWAYCVGAGLATGLQRDVFRELISQLSPVDLTLGNLLDLKSVVEQCWREFDGRASDRDASIDWRDIMQRSNLSVLFT
ncbi:fungal-specific transcription factor domain-containing protein [Diplogelasinospora grovesii]|uniref:Fungal-specific transcription factor domain-containing protein n=1 Tax=Diplogelasinospora grovesii TaxID=303347 RepID=A0AAN6MXV1_9PEZI|nr:fungal-specific transcription factor domain-containing protein [Diplogelasinospora grovesii]